MSPNHTLPYWLVLLLLPSYVYAQTNSSAIQSDFVQAPAFSVSSGYFTDSFELWLSSPVPNAYIYYTLDGSEPDVNSFVFDAPITVTERSGDANTISLIPTNNISGNHIYNEDWREPSGEIFKITVIRAKTIRNDGAASRTITHTYFVHPDGADRYSLPVFSIVTDPDNFFDDEIGIYVHGNYNNFRQRGEEWERPVHITLFENDGSIAFTQDAGVRIHGGTSRNRPRKSLRLYARGDYGESWFNYSLFPDKDINRYKRFLLRNSGNDWRRAMFRDAFMQSLIKDISDVDIQYTRAAIVFINGEYWGIHNIRDRLDHHYISSHYGIDVMEMTMMENNRAYDRGSQAGVAHFNNMFDFISSRNISFSNNYEHVQTLMDVDNFIDYQAAQIYYRNTDWPGNNLAYWRYNTDYDPDVVGVRDGRWRWLMFDVDFGFNLDYNYVTGWDEGPWHDTMSFALETGRSNWPNPDWSTLIFRKLVQNDEFKIKFVNRFADLFNTVFHPDYVVAQLDSFKTVYQPEITEHIHRWNHPYTINDWEDEVQKMEFFALDRRMSLYDHIMNSFDIDTYSRINITNNTPQKGTVRVNTLEINSEFWRGNYFKGIPVPITAVPKDGYTFAGWQGDITSDNPEIFVTLEYSDAHLTAVFEEKSSTSVSTEFFPQNFVLHQNYPNPFNPVTTISFELPEAAHTYLAIYTTTGQLVRVLSDVFMPPGSHQKHLEADRLSSGIYIYTLRAGDVEISRKMSVIK